MYKILIICCLLGMPIKAYIEQERALDISSLFGTRADAAIDVLLVSLRTTVKVLGLSSITVRDRTIKAPDGGNIRLTNTRVKGIAEIERAGKSQFTFTRLKSSLRLSNLETSLNINYEEVAGGLDYKCRNSTIDLVLEAKIAFPIPIPYLALDSLNFELGDCTHDFINISEGDSLVLGFLVDPLAQGVAKVVADKAKEIFNSVAGSYSFIG